MYSTDFMLMLPDWVVFLPVDMNRAPALLQGAGGLAGGFSGGGGGGGRFQQGRARPVLTASLLFHRAVLWWSSMATVQQLLHSYKALEGQSRFFSERAHSSGRTGISAGDVV